MNCFDWLQPRERGRMRFHMLQNVQMSLEFLHYKKIKLVNIRAEDIVDGNPKLTLGLIWTIILHFQVSHVTLASSDNIIEEIIIMRIGIIRFHIYIRLSIGLSYTRFALCFCNKHFALQ